MKGKALRRMTRGLTVLVLLLLAASPSILAQPQPPTPTPSTEYYSVETVELADGTSLDQVMINGPPTPPPGYEVERAAAPEDVAGSVQLPVPAYDWSYGCSATSAAMIAAYYDRTGYPNMYTGWTNGGVMPMNNSVWGSGECPLSATHLGIESRVTRGHVDDYWISYGSQGPDPWVGNWPEHTLGDCTGDYMETNKWYSSHGFNTDGGTVFFYDTTGAQAPATVLKAMGPPYSLEGCVGIKEFYESRGYAVTTAYNQYIKGYGSNPSLGFTYAQYKAEIDAGRPVMIHVKGHTMVGVGYDDSSGNGMYIHDTWDYSTHTMNWGGSYAGMEHFGVTIVQLGYPDVSIQKRVLGADHQPSDPVTFTLSIENSGTYTATTVWVTDTIPADITATGWSNSPSLAGTSEQATGPDYIWSLPDLVPGATGVITINGTIDSPLPTDWAIINSATIACDSAQDDPDNNCSTVIVGGQRVYLPLVLRNY